VEYYCATREFAGGGGGRGGGGWVVAAAAMDITEVTVVHHAALVLLALWAAVSAGWAHPAIFLAALLYLFAVNERYTMRLRKRIQHEERKCANQRRVGILCLFNSICRLPFKFAAEQSKCTCF
jgi:hypothetical protein